MAIEALQEQESFSELSVKYGIHPNMISHWKKEFVDRAPELFDKPAHNKKDDADLLFTFHFPLSPFHCRYCLNSKSATPPGIWHSYVANEINQNGRSSSSGLGEGASSSCGLTIACWPFSATAMPRVTESALRLVM